MGFTTIASSQIDVDSPVTQELVQALVDRDDANNADIGTLAGLDIQNGSFEIDSDANGIPDAWDLSLFTGGTGVLDTSIVYHGNKSFKFNHPGGAGNGGGQLTSEFFPVSTGESWQITFALKSSVAMKNKVHILTFDRNQASIGETTVFNDTSTRNWGTLQSTFTNPSSCTFIKVRCIGGTTDVDAAGDSFFDDISVNMKPIIGSTAGSYVVSQSSEKRGSNNSDAGGVKLKEMKTGMTGGLKIHYQASFGGGITVGGSGLVNINRNGTVITGTSSTLGFSGTTGTTVGLVYTTHSNNVDDWSNGDLIQLFSQRIGGSTLSQVRIKNMRLQVVSPRIAGWHESF